MRGVPCWISLGCEEPDVQILPVDVCILMFGIHQSQTFHVKVCVIIIVP